MGIMMTSIRTSNQIREIKEILSAELEYFGSPSTKIDSTECSICKHMANFSFVKNGFALYRCSNCEFLFAPIITPDNSISDFFENSKAIDLYTTKVIENEAARKSAIFSPLAKRIIATHPKANRYLEIGCGAGLLLDELRLAGLGTLDIQGVEVNKFAAEKSREKGHNVFQGAIDDFEGENFDVVIFWAFLDHIPDPLALFRRINGLLGNGGLLIFGNANYAGFETSMMGTESHIYSVPERLSFFTPRTLEVLCINAGFNNTSIEGSGNLDLEIVKDWWENNPEIIKNDFLYAVMNNQEIAQNFTFFLQKTRLTSHLTVSTWK